MNDLDALYPCPVCGRDIRRDLYSCPGCWEQVRAKPTRYMIGDDEPAEDDAEVQAILDGEPRGSLHRMGEDEPTKGIER